MAEQPLPEAYLVLTAENGQRHVHRIAQPATVLGRGADCDVVVPSPRVSRQHARLVWDGERFLVEDLGSTNGTRINGAPVTAPTPIRDGDRLELADSMIEFQASAPTVAIVLPAPAGGLSVDPSSHEVRVRGEAVSLTPKEYLLMALLYRRAGAVVTREEIAEEVWPELEGDVAEESIAQLVTRLRRRVEDDPGSPARILTVRGFGYRFVSGPV